MLIITLVVEILEDIKKVLHDPHHALVCKYFLRIIYLAK